MWVLIIGFLILFSYDGSCAKDPFYTAYHAQPLKNWQNDPNGPMFFNGKYHLFMQYNPNGKKWGDMHWYHMVSVDLVHWKHLPVALAPTTKYDCGGIFSGSATLVNGVPTLVYSVACGNYIAVAVPKDIKDPDLVEWVKPSYNPIITRPSYDKGGFRDPTTAWYSTKDKEWRMVIGCTEGTCEFKSSNFRNWTQVGSLHKDYSGRMWECPDFYPLPSTNSFVLKGSVGRKDWWSVGEYTEVTDNGKADMFIPGRDYLIDDGGQQKYDHGVFYASKTFYDTQKHRQILYGWTDYGCPNTDWTGIQTFPRNVLLDPVNNNSLIFNPIEEIELIYNQTTHHTNVAVAPQSSASYPNEGDQLDIHLQVQHPVSDNTNFQIIVMDDGKGDSVTIDIGLKVTAPQLISTYQTEFDLPGGDYYINNTFGMNATSEDCQSMCINQSECVAWVYVAPGVQMPNSRCCLKKLVPNLKAAKGITSGAKYAPAANGGYGAGYWGTMNGNYFFVPEGENANVRVLVDRSVVEIYAQTGRAVQTVPHCPKNPFDEHSVSIKNTGKTTTTFDDVTFHTIQTVNQNAY